MSSWQNGLKSRQIWLIKFSRNLGKDLSYSCLNKESVIWLESRGNNKARVNKAFDINHCRTPWVTNWLNIPPFTETLLPRPSSTMNYLWAISNICNLIPDFHVEAKRHWTCLLFCLDFCFVQPRRNSHWQSMKKGKSFQQLKIVYDCKHIELRTAKAYLL